jgi:hypothetical protein
VLREHTWAKLKIPDGQNNPEYTLTQEMLEEHENVTLAVDIICINKIPFINTLHKYPS